MAVYDLKIRKWRQAGTTPGGAWGQMSYTRLIDELRRSGEVADNEEVTELEFTDKWIRFRMEPK